MNEKDLRALMESLDSFFKENDTTSMPVDIKNPDGSPNYNNIMRLLNDPEFSKYRDANPQVFKNAKTNAAIDFIGRGLEVGSDIAKLGFSLNQIKQAKKIDDKPIPYAKRPQRNNLLRRSIASAYRRSKEGLSAPERTALNEGEGRASESLKQNLIRTGQSSNIAAGLQQGHLNRLRNQRGIAAQSEGIRRQNERRLDTLNQMQLSEDARQQQFSENKFRFRDMPLYQQKIAAKQRLLSSGLTNAFNAGDRLVKDAISLGNMFRGQTPGTIFPNTRYQDDDHPLNAVFNMPDLTNIAGTLPQDPLKTQNSQIPSLPTIR